MATRPERPEQYTQPTDDDIQSYLFGGLNTTATPLNTPYEDSPFLTNIDTNIEGSVEKRRGSRVIYDALNSTPKGVTLVPFTSTLNYNLLVAKNGKNIEIFETIADVSTKVMTKSNVWDASAENLRAKAIRTSENEPRILFMTGVNKPVQLKIIEAQGTYTGTGVTSVQFAQAERFANAASGNCLVFINRVRVSASFSYSSGTLTVTIPSTTGTFVVDLMLITWQWWAEAMLWRGNRYFQSTTRFHNTDSDQNVAIPTALRTDMDPTTGNDIGWELYPYFKSASVSGSAGTYSTPRQPQTPAEYAFGDGSRYVYATDNFVNPSQFFFTFGRIKTNALDGCGSTTTPCPSESVYMLRRRELRLNNNEGISTANLSVYVNGTLRSLITTNTTLTPYMDYWTHENLPDGSGGFYASPVTGGLPKTVYYISFEGYQLGLPGDAKVEVVNKELKHIGSAASTSRESYNDGTWTPIYGLGLYADYKNGYYPASVELYQGRLVLGGLSNQPLTLLFSNVYDSVTPGQFFNFFQVTDDLEGVANDPFDITLNSRPDDRLIATVEFQSSLFALTRRAAFRIHGGQQGALTITNHLVVFVSNIGLVNPQAVTKTDKDIVYLSDTGVYNLLPQVENAEYQASELSIKIRSLFTLTSDPVYENLPWMHFDETDKNLYLGYPIVGDPMVCRRLFVMNTVREAWTEYDTPSGFQSFHGTQTVDRALGNIFVLALGGYRNGSTIQDFLLLKLNDALYFDFIRQYTGSGSSANYLLPPQPEFTYTTQNHQHVYSIAPHADGSQYRGFTTLPVQEVEDIIVTKNGFRLTAGVDYIKIPGDHIYLFVNPPTGQTLTIRPRRPITDSEQGQVLYGVFAPQDVGYELAYVNNVLKTSGYTLTDQTSTIPRKHLTATYPNNSVVQVGQAYLAAYSTPMFVNRTMRHLKVRRWVYMYFDNSLGQYLFDAADANAASSQPTYEVADIPKTRVNASITLTFNSENSGETTADLYGFENVVWDDTLFDINAPSSSFQKFQLFKEPLRGTGYSYQLFVWSWDHATFKVVGYQIDGQIKGRRYVSRFR